MTVRGSSVISGDAALKKAKEVSQLVEALISFGLSPEAIQLLGVHIETSSGALLKSSSATYRLKVGCEKLDQLAELLDIISSQKNATLERMKALGVGWALQNAGYFEGGQWVKEHGAEKVRRMPPINTVTAPGGSGMPSSLTVPSRETEFVGSVMDWLLPALTCGG